MSKGSTPDLSAAAQATAAGNKDAALQQQLGNMTNQVTPYGSVTYVPDIPVTKTDKNGNTVPNPEGIAVLSFFKANGRLPKPTDKQFWAENPTISKYTYYDKKGNQTQATQWKQTVDLSPAQQALYSQGERINTALGNLAENQGLSAITDAMNAPLKAGNDLVSNVDATDFRTSVAGPNLNVSVFSPEGQIQHNLENNANKIQYNTNGNERAQTGFNNNADKIQTTFNNNANQIQLNSGANQQAQGLQYNNSGQIQTNLGLTPELLQQQTTDALYKANTQYLEPQFNQAQQKLESQLANQGITRGSEAYNDAMLNFNNQKQQAYESARNQAISQGQSAAQGMFGMGLQSAQFGNTALGQQFGQDVTAQQLSNSAANQNNQLDLANQAATNQALAQQYNQNLGAAQFGNQALGQQFGQNQNAAQFYNQGAAQNNQLDLSNQQAYNQALAQQFGQGQAVAQNQNAAQQQSYNQMLANSQFQNQALQDEYNARMQQANLYNQAQTQLFGQNLTNAQLNNATSAQQLQQNQAIQQNPINIINALRSGAQMQTAQIPQVNVSNPGQLGQWSGADYLGAAQAQGQQSQAQANSINSLIGQGIGAAGSVAGGWLSKSDVRLKKNIVKLGIHKTLGIGLYTWDYLWGQKGAGVMAQELQKVMPEAVFEMDDGYLAVNYAMLGV